MEDPKLKIIANEEEPEKEQPPYPWCPGNPTVEDCIKAGYCRKDPNCGE
jgi:hypothetical protein